MTSHPGVDANTKVGVRSLFDSGEDVAKLDADFEVERRRVPENRGAHRLDLAAGGSQTKPLENLPRQLTTGEQTLVSAANDFSFGIFRQIAEDRPDAASVALLRASTPASSQAESSSSGNSSPHRRAESLQRAY